MILTLSVRRELTKVTYTVRGGLPGAKLHIVATRLQDRLALEKIVRHFVALSVEAMRDYRKRNPNPPYRPSSGTLPTPGTAELQINVSEDVVQQLRKLEQSLKPPTDHTEPPTA